MSPPNAPSAIQRLDDRIRRLERLVDELVGVVARLQEAQRQRLNGEAEDDELPAQH